MKVADTSSLHALCQTVFSKQHEKKDILERERDIIRVKRTWQTSPSFCFSTRAIFPYRVWT